MNRINGFGEKKLLEQILENLPVAVFCKDPADGYRIRFWNKECERMTGLKAKDAIGKTGLELWPKELAEALHKEDARVIESNEPVEAQEMYIQPLGAPAFWGRVWKIPMIGADGSRLLLGISQDISEQKRLANISTNHEKQLKSIMSNAPGVFFQFKRTPDGVFSFPFVSRQSIEIFGVPDSVAMDNPNSVMGLIWPEDRHSFETALMESVQKMSRCVWEGRITDQSGKMRWVKGHADPVLLNDESVMWEGVILDTTAKREAEEMGRRQELQLASTSRLVALGEMAGAIAHEINTPLSTFLMASEQIKDLCKGRFDTGLPFGDISDLSQTLIETTKDIAKIITGLRRFARDGSSDPVEPTEVGGIIEHALSLCTERFHNKSIDVRRDPPTRPVKVPCRGVEIGQVVLNLLNNSYDAISSKPNAWVRVSVDRTSDSVNIRVSDSGPGIPKEIARRIFEPFFTTKPPNQGTGLGLSVSHGIVQRHGGRLYVDDSVPNTTFVISLPMSNSDKSGETP